MTQKEEIGRKISLRSDIRKVAANVQGEGRRQIEREREREGTMRDASNGKSVTDGTPGGNNGLVQAPVAWCSVSSASQTILSHTREDNFCNW